MSHSYPSDISREQFVRILPTLESARRRTKPRTVDLYDVRAGGVHRGDIPPYFRRIGCPLVHHGVVVEGGSHGIGGLFGSDDAIRRRDGLSQVQNVLVDGVTPESPLPLRCKACWEPRWKW